MVRTNILGPSTYELLPSLSTLTSCHGADRLEQRQIRRFNWRSSENCARIAPTAFKRWTSAHFSVRRGMPWSQSPQRLMDPKRRSVHAVLEQPQMLIERCSTAFPKAHHNIQAATKRVQ
jgi:hypothetical protein